MKLGSRIDFVARRRWPVPGIALAVLACAVTAWQGWQVTQEVDLLQRQKRGLAALQRPSAPLRPAMSTEDIKRHAHIDTLARYLATPWGRLLALFEEHAPSGVVLIKFEPDATNGRIELSGRAPTTKALGHYLIALERDARLSGVLLHHHEVLRDDPAGSIEFTVGAAWGGSAGGSTSGAAASVPAGVTPAAAKPGAASRVLP